MESLQKIEDRNLLKNNSVILGSDEERISMTGTEVTFKGNNNILFIEEGVNLRNSKILFEGNDSVVYLSKNKHTYLLEIKCHNDNAFYIGENNYMSGKLNVLLSEQKHVLIGNDGLFSFGIWIRLADPHIVYDSETKKRKNLSKSVFLGDHVWIGQSAMILKGTKMGSGSILGAMALAAGKEMPSNTSWGGNPAKQIGDNVFFTSACVHQYREEDTRESMHFADDRFIYALEEGVTKDFDDIDKALSACADAKEKLEYLQKNIRAYRQKNRFSIQNTKNVEQEKGRKKGFLKHGF